MNIVFATNNNHKLKEVREIFKDKFNILSLADINCFEDIPETEPTIEGNASLKSNYIFKKYKINCFSDDTGLEVKALDGRPGVYSARYSGENATSEKNIQKILSELENKEDRTARFKTVVSLILDGKEYLFEGIVNGQITKAKTGESDFGYDPIFLPEGYSETFAEMPSELKNKISHRGLAVKKLSHFLNKL